MQEIEQSPCIILQRKGTLLAYISRYNSKTLGLSLWWELRIGYKRRASSATGVKEDTVTIEYDPGESENLRKKGWKIVHQL